MTTVILTNQTDPDEGNATLSIVMEDRYRDQKTLSLRVRPDISTAQIITIVDTLELLSSAKVCHISLTQNFNVRGNKANADTAGFDGVDSIGQFTFVSASSCKDTLGFGVPAVRPAAYSGIKLILGDDLAATVVNFNAAVEPVLQDKGGVRSYLYDNHYRKTTPLNRPNIL